jgi:hypothetical protein
MLSKDLIHVHSRRHQWPRIVDSVLLCTIHLQEKNSHHMPGGIQISHHMPGGVHSICNHFQLHSKDLHRSIYIDHKVSTEYGNGGRKLCTSICNEQRLFYEGV